MAEETSTNSVATESAKTTGNGKRRRAAIILSILIIGGGGLGLYWWAQGKTRISTDNAFVETDIHSVSSRVPGIVKEVFVKDNQRVKKGDLLVELDASDYRTHVSDAEATLDMAKNETTGDYAQVEAAEATVNLTQARLDQANLDLARGKALFKKEVLPKEQLDRLETSRKVAALQVQEAKETLRRAKALVGPAGANGRTARIAQKRAKLEEASLNLSYTKVYAPADGFITKKSVEVGNYIQPGQPLMALVELSNPWVVANYKERQLEYVKPGQKVTLEVDTYPGRIFTGSVDSIMAGTGAAFSLLPPENATGNYVKVVQRIPVKIVIDRESDPDHKLRVGMSVVPTIFTGRRLVDIIKELNPFS